MSISKPARLNKVARDFNVSINTIVEFLEEKGVSVEAKPTTKIDPDMYSLLMGGFAADGCDSNQLGGAAGSRPLGRE